MISKEALERLRKEYPIGCKVELLLMEDNFAPDNFAPPRGTIGTVTGIDSTGSIMVDWCNGSGLNCLHEIDRCRRIDEEDADV